MRPHAARKSPKSELKNYPFEPTGSNLLVRRYSTQPAISHAKMEFGPDSPTPPLCLDAEEGISTPYS